LYTLIHCYDILVLLVQWTYKLLVLSNLFTNSAVPKCYGVITNAILLMNITWISIVTLPCFSNILGGASDNWDFVLCSSTFCFPFEWCRIHLEGFLLVICQSSNKLSIQKVFRARPILYAHTFISIRILSKCIFIFIINYQFN